jgi:muramoyltetrapeptide carboxypeptidase
MAVNRRIMPFKSQTDNLDHPIRPPRLKAGDTIGIAAPSGPFDKSLFEKGMDVLRDMGFTVQVPEAVYQREGFLAGPDQVRAGVLNALFADPAIHGIVCARGGYGATRVLPYLDWETVRRHPKVFVGFSDITVLHWALRVRTGLVTFHGPMGTTLGNAPEDFRILLKQALMLDAPVDLAPSGVTVLNQGEAVGPVVGGNLTLLCHLVGTPYAPRFDGSLLFIEDVTEAPYRLDRMLVQMTLAGCFEGVAGLVLGQFRDCGEAAEIYDVFMRTFGPLGIPVVAGFPIGHGENNATLPIGLTARLTTRPARLTYREAGTA